MKLIDPSYTCIDVINDLFVQLYTGIDNRYIGLIGDYLVIDVTSIGLVYINGLADGMIRKINI